MTPEPRWSRVLLKLSGEAFAGDEGYGIDGKVVEQLASEIVEVRGELGIDVAVVVGGGNIWRGMAGAGAGMDRAQADYMGMLATAINALALQDTLGNRRRLRAEAQAGGTRTARHGIPARFWLYAAFAITYGICETMNGNWSQLEMTTQLGASATQASLALAAFLAMVPVGRVLFAAIGRWLPSRVTYHILPVILVGTFLGISALTRPGAEAGIALFALAGLGCSALLPLTISFGEEDLTAISAAMAGGVIAFYQLGYGIAAFGVGPLQDSGTSLSAIFGFTAIVAGVMALLSFFVTRRRPAPAELAGSSAGDGVITRNEARRLR